jgi:hypothetical protein
MGSATARSGFASAEGAPTELLDSRSHEPGHGSNPIVPGTGQVYEYEAE